VILCSDLKTRWESTINGTELDRGSDSGPTEGVDDPEVVKRARLLNDLAQEFCSIPPLRCAETVSKALYRHLLVEFVGATFREDDNSVMFGSLEARQLVLMKKYRSLTSKSKSKG
jgi:hypothetical protein